ncbi:MAG: hypothetical protein M1820_009370 [Bogoriella megaspora]|nr:MAG: hypothetical protein M1820_009370 [Bogoriella megaspora]
MEKVTASNYFSQMITILVGKEQRKFMIYEGLIRESSPYFAAALKKEWSDGQEGVVRLPHDEPEAFKLYIQWLLADKIRSITDRDSPDKNYEKDIEPFELAQAYVLGDTPMDVDFMDVCAETLWRWHKAVGNKSFVSSGVITMFVESYKGSSKVKLLMCNATERELKWTLEAGSWL